MNWRKIACKCPERAMCEFRGCDQPAVGLVIYPPEWHVPRLTTSICRLHNDSLDEAMNRPWPGIDKPPGADEDWRPSILHHINMNRVNMAAENRMRGRR